MGDRRQTRSQIGPNDSTNKYTESISLYEIMASSKLDQYVDSVRGK